MSFCGNSISFNCKRLIVFSRRFCVTMSNSYVKAIEALNKLQSNADYIRQAKAQKNNAQSNMAEMIKFLTRLSISLEELDTLPVIHIAGTNGKGSTSSYCEAILRKHGYKTGFYSSPHLLEVRERIRLNGIPLSQELFADHFWQIYNKLDEKKATSTDMPLYFRFLTLMAFQVFLTEKVDVAILEVGIGGEFDCTNIIRKTLIAGITALDYDHVSLLGNTLESIAWNKAGIMKPGAQVFTWKQSDDIMKVLRDRSIEKQCTLYITENLYSSKKENASTYIQDSNANLALAITKAFMNCPNNNATVSSFDLELAKKTISSTRWAGRYEIIPRKNSTYYLDGAHTLSSIHICIYWFLSNSNDNREKVLIFNVIGERNPEDLLKILSKCEFSTVIFIPNVGNDSDDYSDSIDNFKFVGSQLEHCHKHKEIWTGFVNVCPAEVFPSFAKAVKFLESRDGSQHDVLVTGSLHLMGAALSVLDPTLGGIL